MTGTGIKPDVENIGFLPEPTGPALGADTARTHQLSDTFGIPDIRGALTEFSDNALQHPLVRERLAAVLAIKHRDRHAPDTLARNAPVRPHSNHVGDSLLAPSRMPLDSLNCFERTAAERFPVHADKPLLRGTEDHRIMATPTMRIAMLQPRLTRQCPMLFQQSNNDRVDFPNRFAD